MPVITPRPLESALFGVAIGSADPASEPDVETMVVQAREANLDLVISRTGAAATPVIHALERHGALLCDLLVTSIRRLDGADVAEALPTGISLRRARDTDAEPVAELARRAFSEFSGHWHADPRLAPELATELYARWGRDLVRASDPALETYLAIDEALGLVGFIAIRLLPGGGADVPLTAVDRAARGRGLLASMLAGVSPQLQRRGVRDFSYETQLTNAPALRTVTRAGFVPTSSRLTFHLWLTDPRRRAVGG